MSLRALIAATMLISICLCAQANTVRIGGKNFTESYVLAEILAQRLEQQGIAVERRFGLGGTKIAFEALRSGEIDLYPEYSGTINAAIVQQATDLPFATPLARMGLATYAPIGFNNTYALVMRERVAEANGITRISDLAKGPTLNIALSHEFRARADGWQQLAAHYGLVSTTTGIEHGLAYAAIEAGQIDLTDAYSTDGELSRYSLRLLEDDRGFFPRYDALWLGRDDLAVDVTKVLDSLSGSIDAQTMQALNAQVVIDGQSVIAVAAAFVAAGQPAPVIVDDAANAPAWLNSLLTNTLTHIQLTAIALLFAAGVGIALALAVQPLPRVAAALLYLCSLAQTIPSIALLALMIPIFGIGKQPAIIALFVYALLPIVRATLTAVNAIEPVHITVADALGMTQSQKRRYVLIPLAMPHILAGLRTAAVISIGTATLAAFIGAGGLGQPIVTGLALNNTQLIMQGAIPAAVLAIVTDLAFDALERRLVPAHLRPSASGR